MSEPEHLFQYGVMGSIYATHILQHKKPRIGLLNIGSEEEKGHEGWVLEDIGAVGGDMPGTHDAAPSAPVQAMIGFNYYAAVRLDYLPSERAVFFADRQNRSTRRKGGENFTRQKIGANTWLLSHQAR